jgi:hypothetical protein
MDERPVLVRGKQASNVCIWVKPLKLNSRCVLYFTQLSSKVGLPERLDQARQIWRDIDGASEPHE